MRALSPPAAVSIVLLAGWLGAALLMAAAVAPAAFAVLPTRTLAGALVGRVLPTLFWSGMAVGLLAAVMGRWLPASVWRTAAALSLVGACAAAQLAVAPRIAALRLAAGGSIESLAPDDPRRVAFGRLHGISVAWMGLGGVAALLALLLFLRLATPEPAATRSIGRSVDRSPTVQSRRAGLPD